MSMSLSGKVIYITGGTGGIGARLVELLQERGANIHLYDRKKTGDIVENLDKISAELQNNTPDILINMAGNNEFDYCENQPLDSVVMLNMLVPMRLTQAVLPAMKRRNSGQIIYIGSMLSFIPLPYFTPYIAAKSGIWGFYQSLRRELGDTNIALTHIAPRAVKTSMNDGIKNLFNERTNTTYDSASFVAEKILIAIIDKKGDVRLGWHERLGAFLNAIIPCLIDKVLKKQRDIGNEILRQQPNYTD
jgi:short-subunit dehydrogenase